MPGRSFRHSVESTAPSMIGISTCSPVRLSVIVIDSATTTFLPPQTGSAVSGGTPLLQRLVFVGPRGEGVALGSKELERRCDLPAGLVGAAAVVDVSAFGRDPWREQRGRVLGFGGGPLL